MASYGNMRDAYNSVYKTKDPVSEAIDILTKAGLLDEEALAQLDEKMTAMDYMKNKYAGKLMNTKPSKPVAKPMNSKAADKRAANRASNFGPGGAMYKDPYKARAGESD